MATVQVNKNSVKTKRGEQQLYIKIYSGEDKPTKIGLKIRVFPENWDNENQIVIKIRNNYTQKQITILNSQILAEKRKVEAIISNIEINGDEVIGFRVKDIYSESIGKKAKEITEEEKLNQYIASFFEKFADKYPYRSNFRLTFANYKKFESETHKRKLKDIKYDLINEYAEWNEKKNSANSTIESRVRIFKSFINQRLKYSFDIEQTYFKYKYKLLETPIIRLTIEEFNRFFTLKLDNKDDEDKKNWFCLMTAIGGIRITSAKHLISENFDKENLTVTYQEFKNEGGNKEVTNPLNKYAIYILDKWNWELPKLVAEQNFRTGLKKIAKKNNFDKIKITDIKKGNELLKNQKIILHEKFNTKLARKTFTSICADLGVNSTISNFMSNHSTKSNNASDVYRDIDEKRKFKLKKKAMKKWNKEFDKIKEIREQKIREFGKGVDDILSNG